MNNNMKTNSPHAWFLAARPKTLAGAAVPVVMGCALGYHDTANYGFPIVPAVLCLLFALIMQIDANFVNDYFDCRKGNDDETRLGPKRACAEGWITMNAMQRGIVITTLLACAVGLPLEWYGGYTMILIGVACVLFCFLYTTLFSYLGMGDLLVLLFFGIVPVCTIEYICLSQMSWYEGGGPTIYGLLFALACGFVIDTLLIVNNYRDIDNDRKAGKKTLIVRVGKEKGLLLYLVAGLAGIVLAFLTYLILFGISTAAICTMSLVPYAILHVSTYMEMKTIGEGRELNRTLGLTARNMSVFGLTSSLALIMPSIV